MFCEHHLRHSFVLNVVNLKGGLFPYVYSKIVKTLISLLTDQIFDQLLTAASEKHLMLTKGKTKVYSYKDI